MKMSPTLGVAARDDGQKLRKDSINTNIARVLRNGLDIGTPFRGRKIMLALARKVKSSYSNS